MSTSRAHATAIVVDGAQTVFPTNSLRCGLCGLAVSCGPNGTELAVVGVNGGSRSWRLLFYVAFVCPFALNLAGRTPDWALTSLYVVSAAKSQMGCLLW